MRGPRLALAALLLSTSLALAQSTPNLYQGQIPTAGQWNGFFAQKQDVLGFSPLNKAGDTLSGYVTFGGTVPVISGCSAGTQTGGAMVGTYKSGTSGTCTVVLTFPITAPNGWSCTAQDLTTPADIQSQTVSAPTTCTISGTTVTGDVINFRAFPF